MIPYFQFISIHLGPITIYVWGLMVSLGIIAAVLLMDYLAKKYILSREVILDLSMWILISAFIFARLFHVLFYNPGYYLNYPLDILKIWEGGASSLGGFFGAGLALYIFAKRRHLSWHDLLPYFDVAALGLWLGWGIGRIGCFLIHDHPGTLSHFVLTVKYPGGARFDLGLMESIFGFALFGVFALLFSKLIKKRWGLVAGYSIGAYAVVRFFLDFLRATDLSNSDVRYGYLTPAQWGMLAILLTLIFLAVYGRIKRLKKIGGVA